MLVVELGRFSRAQAEPEARAEAEAKVKLGQQTLEAEAQDVWVLLLEVQEDRVW